MATKEEIFNVFEHFNKSWSGETSARLTQAWAASGATPSTEPKPPWEPARVAISPEDTEIDAVLYRCREFMGSKHAELSDPLHDLYKRLDKLVEARRKR